MDVLNSVEKEKHKVLIKFCSELEMVMPNLSSTTAEEGVKEICVAKLCETIGIRCCYNYKSLFFECFSEIMGQAVCDKLRINLIIARDELRLCRYEHLNFVENVRCYLETESIHEAFVDAFNFVDNHKNLIKDLCLN